MFRSVDWTHDMIIVKWHLLIWHKRKLCALTNAPPVQSTQTGQWLSTLFHANYSAAQVYVLHPRKLRHFRSELQATIIFAGITIRLSAKKHILKVFVYLMMRNVMVKTCLKQKIIKNSNLIQPMKNSVCPKAKVIRRPNFSESRICPNIYRMFRSVDRRHDMIIVKWHKVTLIQYFRKPNLSEYLPNVPSVDWTHDMIIVKWHLLIWHKRKLCALTNAPTVQSTQTGQWLSTLFHANYSAAQSMSCTLGNTSSLWAAGDDHFCRYYNSTEC